MNTNANIWGKLDLKAVSLGEGLEGFLKLSGEASSKHEVRSICYFFQADKSRKNIFLNAISPFFYGPEDHLQANYFGKIPSYLSTIAYRQSQDAFPNAACRIPVSEMHLTPAQKDLLFVLLQRAERELPNAVRVIKPIQEEKPAAAHTLGFEQKASILLGNYFPSEFIKIALENRCFYSFPPLAYISLEASESGKTQSPEFLKKPLSPRSPLARKYAS